MPTPASHDRAEQQEPESDIKPSSLLYPPTEPIDWNLTYRYVASTRREPPTRFEDRLIINESKPPPKIIIFNNKLIIDNNTFPKTVEPARPKTDGLRLPLTDLTGRFIVEEFPDKPYYLLEERRDEELGRATGDERPPFIILDNGLIIFLNALGKYEFTRGIGDQPIDPDDSNR